MIVIGPAKAQSLLPFVLHVGGAVAALPILALGGEEQVACPGGAQIVGRGGEQFSLRE